MKYLIQNLFMLVAFAGFAQNDLPIYDNLNYVKEYEMILDQNKLFISSPFAKANLNPKDQLPSGKKIKKITYLYSHNNVNPKFAQTSLSDNRYENLMSIIGDQDLSNVKWETQVQVGCGSPNCSKDLDHGFIIEYEGNTPVIGHDELPNQKRTVDASKSSVVKGASGTKINIPADAFVDAFGNAVKGDVQIVLKEALTPEQIVLGNLTTMTDDGKLLQSKGMIKVEAFQGGNQLYLKEGKAIDVEVPTDYEEGYSFFTGDTKDGKLVWTDPVALKNDQKSTTPYLPDGQILDRVNEIKKDQNLNSKQEDISGNDTFMEQPGIIVLAGGQFISLAEEDIIRVNQWTSFGKDDNKKLNAISFKMPNEENLVVKKVDVNPEKLKKMGFRKNEILTIMQWFRNNKVDIRSAIFDKDKIENGRLITWPESNGAVGNISTNGNLIGTNVGTNISSDLSNAFRMSKLGWANVDRFYHNSTKVRFAVAQESVDSLETFEISLVVPEYNIFIAGYKKMDGNYGFTHGDYEEVVPMPVGDQAFIVALGEKNGQTYFQMKEFTIGDNELEQLSLQPTDRESALSAIKQTL